MWDYPNRIVFVIAELIGVSLIVFLVIYVKNNLRNQSPELIAVNISKLFDAIQNRNKADAYISFITIASKFGKRFSFWDLGTYGLDAPYGIFKIFGANVYEVDWTKLKKEFLDILNQYKTFEVNKRILSIEQIDQMFKEFNS